MFKEENFIEFVNLCKGNINVILQVIEELNDIDEFLDDNELINFIRIEVDKKNNIYRLVKKKKIYINH